MTKNTSWRDGRLGFQRCSDTSRRGRGLCLLAHLLFALHILTTQKGKPTPASWRSRTKGKPAPCPGAIAGPPRCDCKHNEHWELTEKSRFFLLSAFSASSAVSLWQSQISGILPPWPIWPIRPHLITAMPRGSGGQTTSRSTSRSKTKRSSILVHLAASFFESATNG